MVKKTRRPYTPSKNDAPPPAPPYSTSLGYSRDPYFRFYYRFLEYRIFKSGKRLHFFCHLRKSAAYRPTVKIEGNREVFLQAGQGVFKSAYMAKVIKVSKDTAKKYMRQLKKEKFISTKRYPSFTVFTLLWPKAYGAFEDGACTPTDTPSGTPTGTPSDTPSESYINQHETNNDILRCTRIDLGLEFKHSTHLLLSYSKQINCRGQCEKYFRECFRDLQQMSHRIIKKIGKGQNIKWPEKYLDVVVKEHLKKKSIGKGKKK